MTSPASLALIALLSLPLPWVHTGKAAEVSHVDGWTVRAHVDRFTGARTCVLSRGRIDFERRALVFHLPAKIDTAAALYRIDGAAPVGVGADEAELAGLGFALHTDDLDNPSGGIVRIPIHRLASATEVQIEAAPGRAPVKFKIGGLSAALDAARHAGCADGDFKPARESEG